MTTQCPTCKGKGSVDGFVVPAIPQRSNWDEYFLNVAKLVASRSTCPRASVGAVLVKGKRIIATGYNGAPSGEQHCTDIGCLMVEGHCQRVIHAETNAIAQAARLGIAVEGATLYYYDSLGRPLSCLNCLLLGKAAGIARVVTTTQSEEKFDAEPLRGGRLVSKVVKDYFIEVHGLFSVWAFRIDKVEHNIEDEQWSVRCSFCPDTSEAWRLSFEVAVQDGRILKVTELTTEEVICEF